MSLTLNPCYGRAFNIWLDEAASFIDAYSDHQELHYVAETTVRMFKSGLNLPTDDINHPFNKYGDPDKALNECFHAVASDVMNLIQESHLRGYVYSFFHSGGANYPEMFDFFDAFLDFSLESTICDNCSDDESTLSEQQQQHQPSPNQIIDDEDDYSESDDDDDETDDFNGNQDLAAQLVANAFNDYEDDDFIQFPDNSTDHTYDLPLQTLQYFNHA